MSANTNDDTPPKGRYLHQAKRFDHLMDRYLSGVASVDEKKELKELTANGFQERFLTWLDQQYASDSGDELISEKVREEILSNILEKSPQKTQPRRLWWGWVAAAVWLIFAAIFWQSKIKTAPVIESMTEKVEEPANSDLLVFKGKQYLSLPDGSRVLMNNKSELSYSLASFENGTREVSLSGEAYFDIAHDAESAFRVVTGSVVTRVLGTAFNVNAQQQEVVVTVARGLVEVSEHEQVYAQVKPNERLTVNTETQQYNTATIKAEEEIAWKNDAIIFDNIDLQEAGNIILEHYGVKLTFTNMQLSKCRITASFLNGEDLDTVLKVLTEMTGASYSKMGDSILIKGGACG